MKQYVSTSSHASGIPTLPKLRSAVPSDTSIVRVPRDLGWTRHERRTSLCYKAPTMRVLRYLAFVITAVWILSIVFAAGYCLVNGCSGASGNNIDGFLPAFGLAPIGLPAFIWTVAIFIRWVWHKLLKTGEKS